MSLFGGFLRIVANKCINEPFKKKIKTMLQFLEIIPEVNYQPSSDRWEYKEFYSSADENKLSFLNRLGSNGWEPVSLEYSSRIAANQGIFKRKLVAI